VLALLLLPLLMARTKQKRARLMILSMLITASLAVISYEPLRKMVLNHNLYFGGSSGFFTDTVMSLTTASMYLHQPVKLTFYFAVAFSLVFLLCLGLIVIRNIHPRKMEGGKWQISGTEILLILAVLAALSTQLQHLLFGTLFLIERTALLFHALLFTSVCYAADRIQWKALNITLVILAVTVIINFSINANFHKTLSWDFDSRNIEILSHINSLCTKEQETCKLDYSWPFDRGINHYLNQQSFSNILSVKNPYDREACNPDANYYLYFDREMKMVSYFIGTQDIHELKKDTLLHFESENILLFRIHPENKAE
jgi:hypothetical protein